MVSTSSTPSRSWRWGDFAAQAAWFDDAAVVFQCHSDDLAFDDSVVIFGNRIEVRPSGAGTVTSVEFEDVVAWGAYRDGEVLRLDLEAVERVQARMPITFSRPLTRTLTRLLGSGRDRRDQGA